MSILAVVPLFLYDYMSSKGFLAWAQVNQDLEAPLKFVVIVSELRWDAVN